MLQDHRVQQINVCALLFVGDVDAATGDQRGDQIEHRRNKAEPAHAQHAFALPERVECLKGLATRIKRPLAVQHALGLSRGA